MDTSEANLTRVSLWGLEDKFDLNGAPDKAKPLKIVCSRKKSVAVQLANGKLTDIIGNITDGRLNPIDPRKAVLSEAFAVGDDGISRVKNIRLLDYLAKQ